ncbi:transporter [Sphingobacteriales bacterium CHB3]|nr:transporter [Sphingobacteriales bacterium CHB3]
MKNPFNNSTRSLRFDRNELSGSFGDIGTDFPLIAGMIIACGLDTASTLVMFGVMQIATGLLYGLPMPVQPLKAMAVLMIAQKLDGSILYGGGLAIGIMMMMLTVTGLLEWLAKLIPKTVVRGIQFGLGLSLASLALKNYIVADATAGYILAAVGFIISLFLIGNRKYPAALFIILMGFAYAFFFTIDFPAIAGGIGLALPEIHTPTMSDILQGFLLLALPQLPLSLSNSVIATRQTVADFFPERPLTIKKIGLTYSTMNLVLPFFGGIPNCHGAGGLAGHYTFGARTGGSVIIYGSLYLVLGLFFSDSFTEVLKAFPLPILGVILLFESLSLMVLMKDIAASKSDLFIGLLVALAAFGLPHGYVIGLVMGTAVWYLVRKGILWKE